MLDKRFLAYLTSVPKVFEAKVTRRPAGLSVRTRLGSGEVLRRMCCFRGRTGDDSALRGPN